MERAWERLAPLTGLTFLSLAGTQFSRLPAVLSRLTDLETLDLLGCNQLTASDEAWRPLQGHPSLRFLNAMWCEGLAAVPALLSTLRRLENVNFCLSGRLREGGGWRHLTALSSLTRLSLTGCGLQGMPAELAALVKPASPACELLLALHRLCLVGIAYPRVTAAPSHTQLPVFLACHLLANFTQ